MGLAIAGVSARSVAVASPPAAEVAAPAARPAAMTAREASLQAKETGQPVEIPSLTSETEKVVANPSGTFTLTKDVLPVRVRRDGQWIPVDSTLRRNADGTVGPAATPSGLRLSGGGGAPLAVMTNTGTQISLHWPESLPTPTLAADTATYPEVLPGVDLQVRADTVGGFSQVLVVKTRQAAANPRLASLHFATVTKGVTIGADASGNLTATDGAGQVRFTAPTPWMWDSATAPAENPNGPAQDPARAPSAAARRAPQAASAAVHPSDASGPGTGAKQAEVGVEADASGVTLTPDRAMLTASDIVFPLYIDPSWHPSRVTNKTQAFAMVHSGHPDTAFFNTSSSPNGLGVGYQNFEPKTGVERAYYRLDTGNIWDKRIVGATLNLVETYSASWGCERHPVSVWHTGAIAPSTTWKTRPAAQSRLATVQVEGANNPGCTGSRPVGVAVTSLVASAAQRHWRNVTIGLTGDEDNRTAIKRFSMRPTLTIDYNSVPAIAAGSAKTNPSTPCSPTGNPPFGLVGKTDVTLSAIPVDPDGGYLAVQFSITEYPGGRALFVPDPVRPTRSTKPAALTIRAPTFADNASYSWKVRALDGRDASAWTTACRFTVDSSKPGQPTVASDDYPSDSDGLPARTPGTFTFSPPAGTTGDDLPACYVYALNVAPPTTVPCTAPNTQAASVVRAASDGTARDIAITPTRVGSNTLYVYARDRAGNPSISEPAKDGYDFTTADLLVPDKPGDFSGDGQPDLLAVGKSTHAGLWLHRGNPDGTVQAATQIGQNGTGDVPEGTPADWTGAITTHADFDGDGAQDLLARSSDGNLAVYVGTGDASPFDTTAGRRRMPLCLINATDDDDEGTPSTCVRADQIIAAGNADQAQDQAQNFPDLIAVVGDQLWLYPANSARYSYGSGELLSAAGWRNKTIAAATIDDTPALWARDNITGELDLCTAAEEAPPGSDASPKKIVSATGWTASQVPLLAGNDVNLDGHPDLWAITPPNNGQLLVYPTTPDHVLGTPTQGTAGWLPSFSFIS